MSSAIQIKQEERSGRPSLVTVDSKEKVNAKIRGEWRFKICDLHKHFPDAFSISYLRIC